MDIESLNKALIDAELRAACQAHGAAYEEVAQLLRPELKVIEHNARAEVVVWNGTIDAPCLSLRLTGNINMSVEERVAVLKTEKPEMFRPAQTPTEARTLDTVVEETTRAGHTLIRTARGEMYIDGTPAEKLTGPQLMNLGGRPMQAKPGPAGVRVTPEQARTMSGPQLMAAGRQEQPRRPAA